MWKSKGIKWLVVGFVILAMLVGSGCDLLNNSPEISSLTPSATSVGPGSSCTVSCSASDADGDALTYAWTATGGTISGMDNSVTWTAPVTEGTYTISVTVNDGKGGTDSESFDIEVANNPPVIASLTPSATNVFPGASCTVICSATDADGDTLTYVWTAIGGIISGTGSSVIWTAPATEGTYTIGVTVNDGKGGIDSESLTINVEMKFGSIDIKSSPSGAAVFLNGVDTGNITPYVITNVTPGTYTVRLVLYHYDYREATVTVNANETTYINWLITYASAQTITIQPAAAAGKDAYVYDADPGTNFGNFDNLKVGSRAAGTYRTYLQFNLASLPDNAVILSARLGLYYYYSVLTHSSNIGAYLVQGAWDESIITWNNQPAVATTPEYSFTVPAAATSDFVYWYISNMVKGWWDGSILNYGVMLKATSEMSWEDWKYFFSSDGVPAQSPKLIIVYYDPTP